MARIAVASGEQLFREALRALLDRDPQLDVVFSPAPGDSGSDVGIPVEIAIVDEDALLSRPSGGTSDDAPAYLAVTGYGGQPALRRMFACGARGVISRNASVQELRGAIACVLRGDLYIHPTLGAQLVRGDAADQLVANELDLVQLIALGHTNAEIARGRAVTERTIELYRSRIMAKLGVRSRVELVRWALDNHVIGPNMPQLL
jgi:DNA-binding NarL/FixJ family response regulator